MTTLTLAPHVAALIGAGVIKAVPIDAERCPNDDCQFGVRWMPAHENDLGISEFSYLCSDCTEGLVAPQPGQWTLTTNNEPADYTFEPHMDGSATVTWRKYADRPGTERRRFDHEVIKAWPAPGQEVGPVTVTAVIPIVPRVNPGYDDPHEGQHRIFHDPSEPATNDIFDRRLLITNPRGGPPLRLSDHLLPGLDWTLPYAALIGNPT